MNEDHTADELAALRRDEEPRPELEDRIAAALRREGVIRRVPRWPRRLAVAAGAAAVFAAGLAAGMALDGERRAPRPTGARYVLFVENEAGTALSPDESRQRVGEYRDWARGMRAQGHDLSGEKLTPTSWALTADGVTTPPATGFVVGGYFTLGARDDDEALRIAGSHPHLRHGGRIVVRRIQDI